MNFFDDFDLDSPIIACCSGTSTNVGVSKIRLSGNFNLPLILPYFSLNPDFSPKPRFCYYLKLVVNNEVLDDLIFIYFPLNFSFTGQQTIELDVHGNVLNVNRIIDFFINTFGFRLARPGEFSYRAYKNKKLSFNEIEGLDLFLNAKSLYALTHGRSLMKGDLYLKIQDLYT
jgi:tRNA modification GTPase